jgi:hypothetical protein
MSLRNAAEDLLRVVEAAIKSGDWKVDGACDPDSALFRLRYALSQKWQLITDEEIAEIHQTWDAGNLWDGWNYEHAIAELVRKKNAPQ